VKFNAIPPWTCIRTIHRCTLKSDNR
jgi:hypothetical protein